MKWLPIPPPREGRFIIKAPRTDGSKPIIIASEYSKKKGFFSLNKSTEAMITHYIEIPDDC